MSPPLSSTRPPSALPILDPATRPRVETGLERALVELGIGFSVIFDGESATCPWESGSGRRAA